MVKNPSGEASNVGYFTSVAEDFNSGLNRENKYSQRLGRDLNSGSPEANYESIALTTRPRPLLLSPIIFLSLGTASCITRQGIKRKKNAI